MHIGSAPSGRLASGHRVRVLHSVGHLLRGGIETWLYGAIRKLDSGQFEHHVMVRTDKEEAFTAAFREAGAKVLPCLSVQNPLKYAGNFRRLVREHGPYDILHVHGSNPNGLMALLLAGRVGIKHCVVHSHNDVRPLLEGKGPVYRAYVSATLALYRSFSDCGLAASILAAESMFGPAWERDPRWQLLYYGIDFEPFRQAPPGHLRRELGIAENAYVMGHVGRFHEQKNHAFLIDMIAAAVRRNDNAHLLLIGDGPLREQVMQTVRQSDLTPHVTLVPDTLSVAQYMTGAMDCFVFPSRYEGLGLVAAEAQAAGLPCLISERVPQEAIIDPALVRVLPLKAGADTWAEAASALPPKISSQDPLHLAKLDSSRFEINMSMQKLADLYQRAISLPNGRLAS